MLVADPLFHARLDFAEDEIRILGARVVARRDDDVGEFGREAAHDRALRAVAVAAAAEDRDDVAFRDFARRPQHVFDAVRRVRVVDDDGEILPRLHEFEAARDGREALEHGADMLRRDMLGKRRTNGAHDVIDIEDARDMKREGHFPKRTVIQREMRTVRPHVDVRRAQRSVRRMNAIRQMRARCMAEHRPARRVVDVDDGRLALLRAQLADVLEQLRLRELVIFHRLMIIEVVLREVREDRRVKLDARDAVLVERVRRDFHDDVVHAFVAHECERVLQLDDVRRRVVDRQHLVLDHDLDRADEADLFARMAQNRARQIARRRLAVRARDADDAHCACRVIMEEWNDRVERRLELRHDELRHACGHLGIAPRRQHSDRALLDGLRDERVAVNMHARNRDEQRARLDLARIVLDGCDVFIVTDELRACDERGEPAEFLHLSEPPQNC